MNTEESGASVTAGCLLMLLAAVIYLPLHGWAITVLWRWFVTPTFGLAVPSIWMAAGLSLVAALLVSSSGSKADKDTTILQDGTKVLWWVLFRPLFYVGMGWLAMLIGGL